ncbi:MAG: class I SAM-dependent methyltransferase [Desulfobacteraceae bacterium]|jgi:ubiquinone/menaquinone biosynthesis C-methylase UbiE
MPTTINLYESPALQSITGPTIRPGGLALTQRALDFCNLPYRATVLDVGCGCGATVAFFKKNTGIKAFGIDLSLKLLRKNITTEPVTTLIQGYAQMLPIGHESLTAIFCECVLSLIERPETALLEWHRVLAPDGYLIISDLYTRRLLNDEKRSSLSIRCCLDGAVDRETLFARMTAAGFQVLLFEDHTPMLKQMVAQMVWRYGSLASFWSAMGNTCNGDTIEFSGKPGYYLMVARKGEIRDG